MYGSSMDPLRLVPLGGYQCELLACLVATFFLYVGSLVLGSVVSQHDGCLSI